MENKIARDINNRNHFIKIVAGFKTVYNQKQYLVYVEVPKRKRDVVSDIYIGKFCFINNQNLLFKFETEDEKATIFPLLRQVLSGNKNDKIEMITYDSIEEITIIGSNRFEDSIEMYPNFTF